MYTYFAGDLLPICIRARVSPSVGERRFRGDMFSRLEKLRAIETRNHFREEY